LAGKAHDTKNTTEDKEYYKVNFEMTKQIFDAFIRSNASTFIFLSTIKAVGDDKTYVHNADDLGEPTTPYAKSKREAEKYIQNHPLPLTKRHYILRPCLIYGPNVKGNLADLVQFVEKETPYPLAAFQNKRSYLSVENLSYIFLKLLEEQRPSFTLNISNEDAISTVELIEIIAKKLQKKARTFSIPESIVRLLAKLGDKFSFIPINSEKLKKLTDSFVVDTGEMNKKLGFELPHKTRDSISSIVAK
jgi:nucleoside-diphosphate-sugar epimerase